MQVGHFSAAAFPYKWVTFRLSKTTLFDVRYLGLFLGQF